MIVSKVVVSDEAQTHETVESGSAPAEGNDNVTADIATPEDGGTDNGDTAGSQETGADQEVASGQCVSASGDNMAFIAEIVKKSVCCIPNLCLSQFVLEKFKIE